MNNRKKIVIGTREKEKLTAQRIGIVCSLNIDAHSNRAHVANVSKRTERKKISFDLPECDAYEQTTHIIHVCQSCFAMESRECTMTSNISCSGCFCINAVQ